MTHFMSIKDAASFLGVEYKTVWSLVRSGEMRSTRVGKQYRITRQDIDDYLAAQATGPPQGAGPPGSESAPDEDMLICGNCGRVIPSIEMSGDVCGGATCDEQLCRICWDQGLRYCARHQPSGQERLAEANSALKRGQVDRVVTAIQARQREQVCLARFDERVYGIARLQHPLSGEMLQVDDWSRFHSSDDESDRLLEILGLAFLERSLLAVTPLNASSRFEIEAGGLGRNKPGQGLILETLSISDMEAQARQKVVTQPSDLETLMVHLNERQVQAEQSNTAYVLALAATGGWDQPSIDHVSANPQGRSYRHRLLLPLLVDLHSGQLHYDQSDERLRGFLPLFSLTRDAEDMLRMEQWIEASIQAQYRSGLTLAEVTSELGASQDMVQRVFTKMAGTGRYRFVADKETGGTLIVVR